MHERKGEDRWYVTDPNKACDLEKRWAKTLLKEFWRYLSPGYQPAKISDREGLLPDVIPRVPSPRSKCLKVMRMEALRAGFRFCWQNRDYRTFIAFAQRIPDDILQEDATIMMWHD